MLKLASTCLLFSLLATPCVAGEIELQVFDKGEPAHDVTVCVGSYQQRALYGTTKTDRAGTASFQDLPEGRIVVTASVKTRGRDKTVSSNTQKQGVMIALPEQPTEDTAKGTACPD